jgi:hypothetical protein
MQLIDRILPASFTIVLAFATTLVACDESESTDTLAERVALVVDLDDYEVHESTPERDAFVAGLAEGTIDPGSPAPQPVGGFTAEQDPVAGVRCGEFSTDDGGDGMCGYCSFGSGTDSTTCFANETACGAAGGQCVSEKWFDPTPRY